MLHIQTLPIPCPEGCGLEILTDYPKSLGLPLRFRGQGNLFSTSSRIYVAIRDLLANRWAFRWFQSISFHPPPKKSRFSIYKKCTVATKKQTFFTNAIIPSFCSNPTKPLLTHIYIFARAPLSQQQPRGGGGFLDPHFHNKYTYVQKLDPRDKSRVRACFRKTKT